MHWVVCDVTLPDLGIISLQDALVVDKPVFSDPLHLTITWDRDGSGYIGTVNRGSFVQVRSITYRLLDVQYRAKMHSRLTTLLRLVLLSLKTAKQSR
jgi:hypothetical protein